MATALALLSGGLDSTLAIKAVMDQEVKIEAINFITPFCPCSPKDNGCHISKKVAHNLGISLHIENVSRAYLAIVKSPLYGYGKNLNPCIDCRSTYMNSFRQFSIFFTQSNCLVNSLKTIEAMVVEYLKNFMFQ